MKLELQNIQKSYRKNHVLQNISLWADPGVCVGILGQNGCGKSTLLGILAGLIRPDGGRFLWDGEDLFKNISLRRKIVSFVPQGTPLLEELTALDNLRLWYGSSGYDLSEDLKNGVPAMLGINEFLHVPVRKMSGGMKKRLSISCAVAQRPALLLLDEPSAALDLIAKERIGNYIQDFKHQGGIILIATHDMQEMSLCDCWFILKNGVLSPYIYDGNVHSLVGRL